MKRSTPLLVVVSMVGVFLLGLRVATAASAPLPSTLQVSGFGPSESSLIQPSQSPWYVTMNYTPLNGSASISIINPDLSFRDYKLVPAVSAGTVVYQGQGTDPVYIENYAGSWTLSLSY